MTTSWTQQCPAVSDPPKEDAEETTRHICDLPEDHHGMHQCHCGARFVREQDSGWQR